MKLQGRNLKFNMRGDDVKALQGELHVLGFTIAGGDGFFGKTTRQANAICNPSVRNLVEIKL